MFERFTEEWLLNNLLPYEKQQPFPPASDRAAWEKLQQQPLNRERRAWLVGLAESALGQPWPALPATLYMEFLRNGNRTNYQTPYFKRRQMLADLALAECLDFKGKFLDEIANGIWLISEEASWCLPAHAAHLTKPGGGLDPLPRQDLESVDLFACETAAALGETLYILRDALSQNWPSAVDRIEREIIRRVIEPVEKRDDFWWFSGRNNWTPWCASNTLIAASYVLKDKARFAKLARRLLDLIERFVGHYGDDGGCDEGPSYWSAAAGAMLIFLEQLYALTDGAFDVYANPKIAAMGRFISTAHIDGEWFVNFADAPARMSSARRSATYRYGKRINEPSMINLVFQGMGNWGKGGAVTPLLQPFCGGSVNNMLRELFWLPADIDAKPADRRLTSWLPDIQVLVARSSATPGKGLVLAAKGGHNDESHNHNDIGNFVIFLDGNPGIIDIGVETYTRKTFSAERYDIWCIRASGHNPPLVNGVEQVPGKERRATEVKFSEAADVRTLSMRLDEAYPAEARLKSLRRSICMASTKVMVKDEYELTSGNADIDVVFYAVSAKQESPGLMRIPCGKSSLLMRFNPDDLSAAAEEIALADENLRNVWGNSLTRITLKHRNQAAKGFYELEFEAKA